MDPSEPRIELARLLKKVDFMLTFVASSKNAVELYYSNFPLFLTNPTIS